MADKIAVFGGSFDPIHNGHIYVAESAIEECSLDRVIFLPNAVPPHKDIGGLTDAYHRFNMVKLATEPYSNFEVSDYEMKSKHPSYTIDTMRHIQSVCNADMYFIIGADSLYTLNTWKLYDELIKECKFIVADRNCKEGNDIYKKAEALNSKGAVVKVLSIPKYDVTSTFLRECVLYGKDISDYVPTCVAEYIKANNLYKSNPED